MFLLQIDNTSPKYRDWRLQYLSLHQPLNLYHFIANVLSTSIVGGFFDTRQNSERLLLLNSIMSSIINAWMTQCPFKNMPTLQRTRWGVTKKWQAAWFSRRLASWPEYLLPSWFPFILGSDGKTSTSQHYHHLIFRLLLGTDFP